MQKILSMQALVQALTLSRTLPGRYPQRFVGQFDVQEIAPGNSARPLSVYILL